MACAGTCFFASFRALKMIFEGFREKRELKRKIEWGEILDITTVLKNIDAIGAEAVTTTTSKLGTINHLVVLRGGLISDSTLESSFEKNQRLIVKVTSFDSRNYGPTLSTTLGDALSTTIR